MSHHHIFRRAISRSVLALFLGMSLSACAAVSGLGSALSWKEEVLLHDSRIMVVERSQTLGGRPTIASRERVITVEEWAFPFPGMVSPIVWKTGYCNPPRCDNLMLLLVGLVDGVPYLATSPAGCLAYNYWGRPNPPYVFFKYVDKGWTRIDVKAFPQQLNISNVVVGRPDPKNRAGVLNRSTVAEENRLLESYRRQIAREEIKAGPTGCEELVFYKGAWIGPGDSIGKRMIDRMTKPRDSADIRTRNSEKGD